MKQKRLGNPANRERQKRLREKRKAAGLVQRTFWLPKELSIKLRKLAEARGTSIDELLQDLIRRELGS